MMQFGNLLFCLFLPFLLVFEFAAFVAYSSLMNNALSIILTCMTLWRVAKS